MLRALAAACVVACASGASAATYSFVQIGDLGGAQNSAFNVASQLFVDVTNEGGGQARFTFRNTGPLASTISEIYFDAENSALVSLASIINGAGVNFTTGANPSDLPGGGPIGFTGEMAFNTEAVPPPSTHGVDPGEQVSLIFNISTNFGTLLGQIDSGVIWMGLHVISLPDGQSDGYVNNGEDTPPDVVPLPTGVALGLAGLAPLAMRRRR
ncbi:MAG: hypothetical protein ACF8QF_00485 [Phycisphaerales bacterium]